MTTRNNTFEVFTTPITSSDIEASFDIRFVILSIVALISIVTFLFFSINIVRETTSLEGDVTKYKILFVVLSIFFIFLPIIALQFNSEYKDVAPRIWENNKEEIIDNAKSKLNNDNFDLDDACNSYSDNTVPGPCGGDMDIPLPVNIDGNTKRISVQTEAFKDILDKDTTKIRFSYVVE